MKQSMKAIVGPALSAAGLFGVVTSAHAQFFTPGNLVVSGSTYQDTGAVASLKAGNNLPDSPDGVTPYQATADGTYPNVFNNNTVDGSFGVTSPIFLQQFTVSSTPIVTLTPGATLNVPTDLITTSFSSKSELSLNLSTDGTALTFMGYDAPVGNLDVSNSTTPGAPEPGNYVTTTPTFREVAQVDANGSVQVTTTNAYSGNNGRAAILDNTHNQYLTVGNAGNGNGSTGVTFGAGVQSVTPGQTAPSSPPPGTTQVGSFNVTQVGLKADKAAKDNNFRGETIFNNTLYVTKGSGGNGIDTVYQVGQAGSLPTGTGNPINALPGFPIDSAKTNKANFYPFGLFFANPDTLYVADEGNGTLGNAAADKNSGLEKWSFNGSKWGLDYTLQTGLNLGMAYTVANPADPTATYTTATDGLRNLTGKVVGNDVTLFGITSTVSTSGDQGADPNALVAITDDLSATTLPTGESFTTLETAGYGQVLRGVAFAPSAAAVPEPSAFALLLLPLAGLGLTARRRAISRA